MFAAIETVALLIQLLLECHTCAVRCRHKSKLSPVSLVLNIIVLWIKLCSRYVPYTPIAFYGAKPKLVLE